VVGEQVIHSPPLSTPNWWHRLEQLLSLHLPDLSGKTVLDVGAGDGYFSFAAERFGASRVVAVDSCMWPLPGGKDDFERARRTLGSNVEDLELEGLDISPETVGRFDVVLFLGLLHHMPCPLPMLERLAGVTGELLVVETLVDIIHPCPPAATFAAVETLDSSRRWCPNRAAVSGMLNAAGFNRCVAYPLRRLSATHIAGLPAHAKIAKELVFSTHGKSRWRRVEDLALHSLTQNRLVAHGWS
jgi:tRNA (mo5U34)-methyltransferase